MILTDRADQYRSPLLSTVGADITFLDAFARPDDAESSRVRTSMAGRARELGLLEPIGRRYQLAAGLRTSAITQTE